MEWRVLPSANVKRRVGTTVEEVAVILLPKPV
jgi:hypothetical protein